MNEKQHIAFFMPNLSFGGVQSLVFFLARDFQKKGYKVTVFGFEHIEDNFLRFLESQKINYVNLITFNFLRSPEFSNLSRAKKLVTRFKILKDLKKYNFDIIFSFTSANQLFSYLWKLTGAKKFIFHDVGGHPNSVKKKYTIGLFLLKKSKPTFVVNSHHCKKSLSYIYGLHQNLVHVVENGTEIDTPQLSNLEWRKKVSLNQNTIVILMMANFFKEKDPLTLIKAYHKLSRLSDLDVALLLSGIKIDSCSEVWEECQDYVIQNKLTDKVIFLNHVEDKNGLQNMADIAVLSSNSEGRPNYVMEMMLHGKPFIGSNIPGIQEILNDSNFLFEIGNIDECFDLLVKLCKSAEIREQTGQRNQERAVELFNVNVMFNKYLNLI